ncbi:hypothetical protein FGL86_11240 [Pistricoccus aurantiacus]|uniref:Uncharacterized protein n=1 Tax=Pistricoccus aurantiacus TaxID=1883414 RepID=A0A5B8SXP4_9GAMM|nr:polysialyltransferase family glycosyltransferase [Pistricoccus aurantiacus]QEA39593.1 hypothetical protein FGL86_11240 [Pistricoccus aurantiacus]
MVSKFYVFDIITPFHLISSLAFCLSKGRQGDLINVNIIPSMKGDLLLEEADFITTSGIRVIIKKQECCAGIKDLFSFFLHRYLRFEKVTESCIYIGHHTYFKPSSLFFLKEKYKGKALKTFSFEEGIGSYSSLKQEKEVALREGKKFYFLKFFLKKIFSTRFFLNFKWGVIGASDFSKKEVKKKYTEACLVLKKSIFLNDEKKRSVVHNNNPMVIFFSSPLVELGVLSQPEFFLILKNIENIFLEKGVVMYVKAHPLEYSNVSKRFKGFRLYNTEMPAEIALIDSACKYVAGFNSGALITVPILTGIEAINFYELLPEKAKKKLALNKELKKIFCEHATEYSAWAAKCTK